MRSRWCSGSIWKAPASTTSSTTCGRSCSLRRRLCPLQSGCSDTDWCRCPMRSATLTCAITLVLVQACAVGPDFETPESTLPPQWHAPATQVSAADVDAQWWKQFNDATLNDLVDRALQGNPDVRIAALRVAESRAQRGAVAGARWPTVDAAASYQRNRQSENGA